MEGRTTVGRTIGPAHVVAARGTKVGVLDGGTALAAEITAGDATTCAGAFITGDTRAGATAGAAGSDGAQVMRRGAGTTVYPDPPPVKADAGSYRVKRTPEGAGAGDATPARSAAGAA